MTETIDYEIDYEQEVAFSRARRQASEEKEEHREWGRHLRDLREQARDGEGLSQVEAAQRSGVHVKTLSSLETGARIGSMKVTQLRKLCEAYGITLAQFFAEVQP